MCLLPVARKLQDLAALIPVDVEMLACIELEDTVQEAPLRLAQQRTKALYAECFLALVFRQRPEPTLEGYSNPQE